MATPTSGDQIVDQVQDAFGALYKAKIDWGTFAGLADVEVRKLARATATEALKWIKPGNPLKHPLMNRGLGMLSGRMDTVADKTGDPKMKLLYRKLSDFIDEFCGAFFEQGATEHEPKKAEADVFIKEAFAKCEGKLMEDNLRLLLGTLPENMDVVGKALADRTEVWRKNKNLLHGPEKKLEEPGAPLGERMKENFDTAVKAVDRGIGDVNIELAKGTQGIKEATERHRMEREEREAVRRKVSYWKRMWHIARRIVLGK